MDVRLRPLIIWPDKDILQRFQLYILSLPPLISSCNAVHIHDGTSKLGYDDYSMNKLVRDQQCVYANQNKHLTWLECYSVNMPIINEYELYEPQSKCRMG